MNASVATVEKAQIDQHHGVSLPAAAQKDSAGDSIRNSRGLIVILVIYLCLAFYRIGEQSLWVDEVSSVISAHPDKSFSDVGIWRLGSRPLYFTLLHMWAQLGTSETLLRSFSALIGMIGVFIAYLLARNLFSHRIAVVGTALFATSPFLIWYSQEVRYATFLITSSLFSMYAYHQALSTKRSVWWWAYCCSLVVAIGAFLTNVLVIVIQAFYLPFSAHRRGNLRNLLICQVIVLSVFVWWANGWQYRELGGYWQRLFNELTLPKNELAVVPSEERFARGGKRSLELAAVPYAFFAFSTGFSLGPSVRELQMDRSVAAVARHAPTLLIVSAVFGGLFITGLFALARRPKTAILVGLWLAVPLIAACAVSALTHAAFNVRYVAMAFPAYLLVLIAGVSSFRSRGVQNTVVGCVLVLNGFSLSNYYFDPRYAREDARGAAEYLESVVLPRDVIVILGSQGALKYYFKGQVPMTGWGKMTATDGLSEVSNRLHEFDNYDRLWLVEIRRWEKDRTGKVRQTAEQLFGAGTTQRFAGVDIHLYDLAVRR